MMIMVKQQITKQQVYIKRLVYYMIIKSIKIHKLKYKIVLIELSSSFCIG